MSVVKVIMRKRHKGDIGPSYVTICMAEHWSHNQDTIMCTSGTWDATKFSLEDSDAEDLCNLLNKQEPDTYEVVNIDERHLSSRRNEYWEDEHVNCGFKKSRVFKNSYIEKG